MKKFILIIGFLLSFLPFKIIPAWENCNNTFAPKPEVTTIGQKFYIYFGTPNGIINLYKNSDTSILFLSVIGEDLKDRRIYKIKNLGVNRMVACTNYGLYYALDYSYRWTYWNLKDRSVFSIDGGNNFFAVGTDTGVFYSTNFGLFWFPSSLQGITVYDIIYTEEGFFAGTVGGLYFSSDTGKSWIAILPKDITVLSLHKQKDPQNSQTILWAGTNQGLFRAKDNPLIWSKVEFDSDSVLLISSFSYLDKTDGSVYNNVYVLTSRGLFYSSDFGDSWNNIGFNDSKIRTFSLDERFIVVTQDKIFLSTDYGKTWKQAYYHDPDRQINVLALNSTRNTLYASILGKGLFISTNYGDSWDFKQTEKSNILSFLVEGDTLIFSTFDNEIYTSTDNGTTWNNLFWKKLNVWSFVRWKDAILAGTDDGVYVSWDWGFNWNRLGLADKIVLSLLADNENLIAGTSEGIFISNDNGFSWSFVDFPSQNVWALGSFGGKYIAGSDDGLWESSNGGLAWYKVGLDGQQVYTILPAYSFVFVGCKNGVFVYYPNTNIIAKGYFNLGVRCMNILDDYVFVGTQGFGIFRSKLNDFISNVNEPFFQKSPKNIEIHNSYKDDFIRIFLKDEQIGNLRKISFFDLYGKEVYKDQVSEFNQSDEISISKSFFGSGIYFVKLDFGKDFVILPIVLLK